MGAANLFTLACIIACVGASINGREGSTSTAHPDKLIFLLVTCISFIPIDAYSVETSITTTSRQPGRLWPATPPVDVEDVQQRVKETCSRLGVKSRLASSDFIVPEVDEDDDSTESSLLGSFLQVRANAGKVPGEIGAVVDQCGADSDTCGTAWQKYFIGLAWPFLVPLALCLTSILLHSICCFVCCCRCCRRAVCCKERQEPYKASRPKRVAAFIFWAIACAGISGLAVTVHEISINAHLRLNTHLCAAAELANEAVGGTDEDPRFLGTARGLENLEDVSRALDVDGKTMRLIRRVISSTGEFAQLHDALRRRIEHFINVVSMSGPATRVFEHRCVFCSLAVGDKANSIPGYPNEGLLRALSQQVQASSAQAMYNIRRTAENRLTGENLTELARDMKRATGAVAVLDHAFRWSLVEKWPRQQPSIDAAESVRLGVFGLQGICAQAGAAIGMFAFLSTRVRQKRQPNQQFGGKVHALAWCCGFCYTTGALLLGGSLLVAAVSIGEFCEFTRLEILTDAMVNHREALGLIVLPEDDSNFITTAPLKLREEQTLAALDLARSCFTANGTGDLPETLDIAESLTFQTELTNAFLSLEALVTEPPAGRQTAEMLETLRRVAEDFGDLFVLDPMPLSGTGNTSRDFAMGVLELSPNVKDLLLGSTLEPEDKRGPDEISNLRGLNSYAALIAGPGKYTFLHGTAGGGFVITPNQPTDTELQSLPLVVRNALIYGRAKEQLLASNSSLRCDELDNEGQSNYQVCGVPEFRKYVIAEVSRIEAQAARVSEEAAYVEGLFLSDLIVELLPTLRKVRDLRTIFNCRLLWEGAENLYGTACTELAPLIMRGAVQLLVLAACAGLGVSVQYKVWRHLKDNKVVTAEMERFRHALGKFEEEMNQLNKHRQSKEARLQAYKHSVLEAHLHGDDGEEKEQDPNDDYHE